ncbi:hypothetical protein YP76_10030 [Sphingobium chungbukense]|uniref:NusG-like N-terminal domain-containing protein n=2 Tax=Sphingobium chungbukense TaxID=56193 RepID=A0A0M3AQZ7_9SPHN|nr:hypothetical protein YP76_10030 [Sphingobium chungbukense]
MTDMNDRWCILRMSGAATLPVATALTETGYRVWTPVELQKRRRPRSKATKEVTLPLMPGIIFAADDRLHDLVTMSRSPSLTYQRWNPETERMEIRGCPYFSVFRYQGKYPRIADRTLDPLRQAEQRGRFRAKLPTFKPGDNVRHPVGMLGGLTGVVLKVKRRKAVVMFGSLDLEVEICDLLPAKTAA